MNPSAPLAYKEPLKDEMNVEHHALQKTWFIASPASDVKAKYVGETNRCITARMYEHLRSISTFETGSKPFWCLNSATRIV